MGGFLSPMEKECLDLLLRGKQPVIVCYAKRLSHSRLPEKIAGALKDGRMLMISPFDEKVTRSTAATASIRNEFVAALAIKVFIAYAAPSSKTEQLCMDILKTDKPLFTLNDAYNRPLIDHGAIPIQPDNISALLA